MNKFTSEASKFMNYDKLRELRSNLYFTVDDVMDVFELTRGSARVLCNRYTKKGIFLRLKNNFYILEQSWEGYTKEDFLRVSNYLQVPSYISLMTALSFYEVTTQVQKNYFESVSLKRSVRFNAGGAVFSYCKLKKDLYFDFSRRNDVFIATREKAFVDAAYLCSFGKYSLDVSSLDLGKLDKRRIKNIVRVFPQRTKGMVKKICGI